MSMQDPMADMLTRIRNAQMARRPMVSCAASGLKLAVLKVMQEEGFIDSFSVISEGVKKDIQIVLKYYQQKPVIRRIRRISKSGCRVYCGHDKIPVINSGLGITIVSTPQGVFTGRAAAAKKLGGEVLCSVE